jgi:hypothetical protein
MPEAYAAAGPGVSGGKTESAWTGGKRRVLPRPGGKKMGPQNAGRTVGQFHKGAGGTNG